MGAFLFGLGGTCTWMSGQRAPQFSQMQRRNSAFNFVSAP